MSVVNLIDEYLLEYGNARFLEGWYGAVEHIVKQIEDKHAYHYGDVYGYANCNCYEIIGLMKE